MSVARFTGYAVALLSSVFFADVLVAGETNMAPRPGGSADMALMQLVDPPVNKAAPAGGDDTEEKGKQAASRKKAAPTDKAASKSAPQADESSGKVMALGKDVYLARCAICHKEEGVGGLGGAPSLVGNYRLRNERKLIEQILAGGQYMPGFAFLLTDSEVAAVATYIRNSWTNSHGPVVEAQVTEMR